MESSEQLRQRLRQARANLSPQRLERAATALSARVLALGEYRRAARIAAYFAVNGEIDLSPVIEQAWSQEKTVYLPILQPQGLLFAPYVRAQKMCINRFRLPEPDVDAAALVAPQDLDLVLTPLVAFDCERNRIGMGGGYYDRSFAFRRNPQQMLPTLVGVAHEIQKVDQILAESWDVRLDMIVTDEASYR